MPVFSYLAYPVQGAKTKLVKELSAIDYCDVTPSENEEILILVTDTPDENEEKKLQHILKQLPTLQSLSMTFGYTDE